MFIDKEKLKERRVKAQSTFLEVFYDYDESMNFLCYKSSLLEDKKKEPCKFLKELDMLNLAIDGSVSLEELEKCNLSDIESAINIGVDLIEKLTREEDVSEHELIKRYQFVELTDYSRSWQQKDTVRKFIDERKILF